ncbi:unnamed protein product [Parajaminaea phylloscopi]
MATFLRNTARTLAKSQITAPRQTLHTSIRIPTPLSMSPAFIRPSSIFFDDPFTRTLLHPDWPFSAASARRQNQHHAQRNATEQENADHHEQRKALARSHDDQGHTLWPIFSGFGLVPSAERFGSTWGALQPRIDLYEEADKFKLSVEIAGVSKDNVKVTVDDEARRVTISGEVRSHYDSAKEDNHAVQKTSDAEGKDQQQGSGKATPIITERVYGSFSRSLTLPETAQLDALQASFGEGNGVLNITVPKKKEQTPVKPKERTIDIGTSATAPTSAK